MANPNLAKLKKKAADFEQKKQFDRALSLYIQLLEEAGRDLDDADLQLFNRVGDLLQRQGNVSEALAYYEKAVDVYAERGFLNNAIALCNKVLRQSPARTSVYYKLGKISATKGFKSDAKKNFLEYAERMQKAGHIDEAFRALKEFADLCPEQDDIRLMLAEWLQKENRTSEAVEQLETLYIKLEEQGREAEARATIDRIKAIDPNVVPRASGAYVSQKSNDLVFLDLDHVDAEVARRETPNDLGAPVAASTPSSSTPRIGALEGLVLTFDPDEAAGVAAPASLSIDGLEATAERDGTSTADVALPVDGLESSAGDESAVEAVFDRVPLIEGDSWGDATEPVPLLSGLETPRVSVTGANPVLSALIDEPPMSSREFGDLPLRDGVPHARANDAGHRGHDLSLPSTLPLLDGEPEAIDLLRLMETPLGSPIVSGADDDEAPATIDLTSLPPLRETMAPPAELVSRVTGSISPVHSEGIAPDDAGADAPVNGGLWLGGGAHGDGNAGAGSARDGVRRDTTELVAQDGTARTTDELLVVASEEIDDATRRTLGREYSLDGDETPDAWLEAALGASDDFSLDHLLTAPVVPESAEMPAPDALSHDAHVPTDAEQEPDSQNGARSPDEATRDAGDTMEERFARLANMPDAWGDATAVHAPSEHAEDAPIELLPEPASPPAETAAATSVSFDLLDELVPPFMRHDDAATRAEDVATGEALAQLLSEALLAADESSDAAGATADAASALDVEALRSLMQDRAVAAPPHASRNDPELLDADAGRDEHVALPLLDVEALLPGDDAGFFIPLDLDAVVADDIIGEPPSFGQDSTLEFEPDPLFAVPPDDSTGAPTGETSVEGAPAAESAADDAWPEDERPEVLIDGEWHDERMGGLVSGEIWAIRSSEESPPREPPRWDDLAAALLWPPRDDAAGGEDRITRDGIPATGHHARRSTLSFGGVEAQLRRRLELDPGNLGVRRQLGEALLDLGKREAGLHELDVAMQGYEQIGDLERARGVADVVLRAVPSSVRHHQKRVEYAVRANDRVRLVEAYVELADSLFRGGEPEKARVVYSRVLELSPENGRARFALGLISDDRPADPSPGALTSEHRSPLPPSPSDMVSMFDLALRRTPVDETTSISAELPIITDGLFTSASDRAPQPADGTDEQQAEASVDVRAVLAFERDRIDAVSVGDPDGVSEGDSTLGSTHADDGDAGEGGVVGVDADDVHAIDVHASDVHASDVDASDVHASDVDASDVDASDVHASDVHASDVHASDDDAADVYVSDLHVSDVDSADVYASDVHASDVHASDEHASDVHASDDDAADVYVSDVHVSDVDAGDVDGGDATAGDVDAGDVDAGALDAGEIAADDTSAAESSAADAYAGDAHVSSPVLDSTEANTARSDEQVGDETFASAAWDAGGEALLPHAQPVGDAERAAPEFRAAEERSDDFPVVPFPAPSLDEQIDEAFAEPPIVEGDMLAAGAGAFRAADLLDGTSTPPLGAAAFATPFSSPEHYVTSLTPTGLTGFSPVPGGTGPHHPALESADASRVPSAQAIPLVPSADDRDRAREGGSDEGDGYVDLGSWLRDEAPVRSTRMVTSEATPSGDEQADFDEMLRRFKQGVAANVDEEDYASHYDLGVAYKEMGLVDEAIAEFQKSLRGDEHRVRSYEALGQCFVEKGQLQVAGTLLQRAVETTGVDDQQLVGVLYLLGYASEVMARQADALRYYQRVFAVDIEFRDVAQRVAAMEQITQ